MDQNNNFNTQGYNGFTNNQPNTNMNNNFYQPPVNNQAPKKKPNIGLIAGIIVGIIAVGIGAFLMFNKNTDNNSNGGTNNSNSGTNNVNLSIDESISKYLTCNLVGNAIYGDKASYSYEYILPNWNRYTFLKDYEPEYMNEPGKLYNVKYDKECKADRKVDSTTAQTNDFGIYIHYSVDKYASTAWANIKDRTTGNLLYTQTAGSPTLYGNDNGYWYAYMKKDTQTSTGEELNELHIEIRKEVAKIEDAVKTPLGDTVVGDEFHALEISIVISYQNETGKTKLNYLLNDLKGMLEEKYNLDLSKLTVDMIKK